MTAVVIVVVVGLVAWYLIRGNILDDLGFLAWLVLVAFLVIAAPWLLIAGTVPAVLVKTGVAAGAVVLITESWGVGSGQFTGGSGG